MLPWSVQVAELERLARVSPPTVPPGTPPTLGAVSSALRCLVCGAEPARPCIGCGAVAYCDEAHRRDDQRWHLPVCRALCASLEDTAWTARHGAAGVERLLASSSRRSPPRGKAPTAPCTWSDWLGRALDPAVAADRALSSMASRPLTLARVLDALALGGADAAVRVHLPGAAAAELVVPGVLWEELPRLVAAGSLELALIGPDIPEGAATTLHEGPVVRVTAHRGLYDRTWWARLGPPHLVLAHDAGLLVYPTWERAIRATLGTGVPFAFTSYRGFEQEAELRLLARVGARVRVPSAPNPFASLAPRRSTTLANDVSYDDAWLAVVE